MSSANLIVFVQPATFLLQRSQRRHHCGPSSSRLFRRFRDLVIRLLQPSIFQARASAPNLQTLSPYSVDSVIRYTPDDSGYFAGRHCYGYVTFEKFVEAACEVRTGSCHPSSFSATLPTFDATMMVTAILEAGRLSLMRGGALVSIE